MQTCSLVAYPFRRRTPMTHVILIHSRTRSPRTMACPRSAASVQGGRKEQAPGRHAWDVPRLCVTTFQLFQAAGG